MTALTLLAEEPQIGWSVFLLIVAASAVVSGLLAVVVWLTGWLSLTEEDIDESADYRRRVELGAAALGKGAKR